MEPISTTFIVFAVIILAASWIMLIFAASGEDFTWTLCSVFLPPLAYLYGLYRWELAGDAIKAAMLGLALLALGILA